MDTNTSLNKKFDYVIFHKNCIDGFSSFFICYGTSTIAKNAIIFPDVPSAREPPPNLHNKHVIIMDVAYNKHILQQIFQEAASVLFIDHHITIKNDVQELLHLYGDQHTVIYDSNKSGASLTWKYFYPNEKLPWFIKYIEDNDIGKWKYKYTIYFILGLQVNYPLNTAPKTIKKWNKLYDNSTLRDLILLGKKYSEYEEYLLNINAKRYTLELFPSKKLYHDFPNFFKNPGQYRVAVINGGGCPSASLLGKKIVTDINCDFCMMWNVHLDKKEIIIAFRSNSTDVGEIAKLFNGGGHKLASACAIPLSKYNITDLFYPNSLPRKFY